MAFGGAGGDTICKAPQGVESACAWSSRTRAAFRGQWRGYQHRLWTQTGSSVLAFLLPSFTCPPSASASCKLGEIIVPAP